MMQNPMMQNPMMQNSMMQQPMQQGGFNNKTLTYIKNMANTFKIKKLI